MKPPKLPPLALFVLVFGLIGTPFGAWAKADLVLSRTDIDFGNMIEGVVAQEVVDLSNKGDAVLKITNVTTS